MYFKLIVFIRGSNWSLYAKELIRMTCSHMCLVFKMEIFVSHSHFNNLSCLVELIQNLLSDNKDVVFINLNIMTFTYFYINSKKAIPIKDILIDDIQIKTRCFKMLK